MNDFLDFLFGFFLFVGALSILIIISKPVPNLPTCRKIDQLEVCRNKKIYVCQRGKNYWEKRKGAPCFEGATNGLCPETQILIQENTSRPSFPKGGIPGGQTD